MATDTETIKRLQAENEQLRHRVAMLEQAADSDGPHDPHMFRLFFEHSSEAMIVLEAGRFIDCNQALLDLFHCSSKEQILELHPAELSPERQPDGRTSYEKAEAMLAAAIQEGSKQFEWEHRKFNGELFPVEILLTVITMGERTIIYGRLKDISERKHAEVALHESQQMLRLVIDNIPQAIFWKDRNLHFLGCNRQFAQSAGLHSPDEIVGKTDYEMPWIEQADMYRADDSQVMETNQARLDFEEPIEKAGGVRGWLRTSKIPMYDTYGEVVAVLGIFEDITERKQHEEELRMFQSIAENAPDAIICTRLDNWQINYANPAFHAMFGYDSSVIGLDFHFVSGEENSTIQTVTQELLKTGTWKGVVDYQRSDGSVFPGQLSGLVLHNEHGKPVSLAGIIRDMSAQIAAEQERLELQQQVIEAQRDALRELSTPLIPISDNVVIMPLIGTVDSQRAQQIMETLLEGIASYQAELAILDITGVQIVDTQVANSIIRTAQAARLLGASVVLTGIQPRIAQTLVTLGVDLSTIITHGTLQAGIAYALQ